MKQLLAQTSIVFVTEQSLEEKEPGIYSLAQKACEDQSTLLLSKLNCYDWVQHTEGLSAAVSGASGIHVSGIA
eukprot:204335-Prorocentrum_lima.AAC.1